DPTSKVSNAYIMYHPLSTGQCAQGFRLLYLMIVKTRTVYGNLYHFLDFIWLLWIKMGNIFACNKDSSSSVVVTSKCICIKDDSLCLDDPMHQWFQHVATNV
ncbi:hypothetical protein L195_g036211, partial [Trifolium pratense]